MNYLKQIELKAYQNWIAENVSDDECIGNCSLWVLVMKQAFPELKIVKGSVSHKFSSSSYHEYLITTDGEIIDPTRRQFDLLFGDGWQYITGN